MKVALSKTRSKRIIQINSTLSAPFRIHSDSPMIFAGWRVAIAKSTPDGINGFCQLADIIKAVFSEFYCAVAQAGVRELLTASGASAVR